MFEKLLKSSDLLSPSVTKLLHKAGLPVGKELHWIANGVIRQVRFVSEEKELLRLTNPDNIRVDASYQGPRKLLEGENLYRFLFEFRRYRRTDHTKSICRFN